MQNTFAQLDENQLCDCVEGAPTYIVFFADFADMGIDHWFYKRENLSLQMLGAGNGEILFIFIVLLEHPKSTAP